MSTFRKLTALAATSLVMTLGACGPDTAEGGEHRLRIGATVYFMSPFITQGKEGMEAYAKARDIDLLWNSAEQDVSTQASQIDQMINQHVDAIIVAPVQADSLGPQLARAKKEGIPVIAVNATLKDTSNITTSVLPDDVKAGEQAMQIMVDKLNGKGRIAILQGALGSSFEIDRTKGMHNILAKNPDIKVVAEDAADWKPEVAGNKVKTWLQSAGGKIDGIVAQNDDMALGAAKGLAEAGRKDIFVVGIDGIEDGLKAVQNGSMLGTNLQHGVVEMAAGLAVARLVATGKPYQKAYTYNMPIITEDNVDAAYQNVVTGKDAFLAKLPGLVDANVASGDISAGSLSDQAG
ncbi:D-threitol-binding protein [Acrocarpospora pleiomorpha]|uniref:D-threitol-binding protein n=1 Tax=Acrocarpospora pleiomorpha TaxID=90975 RepID=A0A5M3XY69_9ACTN|nr:substrate-binding domain-containing protein [Acrocarpospora pleiomorpha]GES26087.1 D-threitol-binding protein [Acrocarpospora pleiomorpha]